MESSAMLPKQLIPYRLPRFRPLGNSIEVRSYIFAIGLVYAVAGYVSNSTCSQASPLAYFPAFSAVVSSVLDHHGGYGSFNMMNFIIIVYNCVMSIVSTLELVYYTCFAVVNPYGLYYLWILVHFGMAYLSYRTYFIIQIAIDATRPYDDHDSLVHEE